MKEIDPLAVRDHMIETIHTVETDHRIAMVQIDPITEMIHIVGIETAIKMNIEKIIMKEIHPIAETDTEIGHIVGIETTIKMTIEVTIDMTTKMIIEMTIEKIIMKEIHPIAKTDTEIGHIVGIETTIK